MPLTQEPINQSRPRRTCADAGPPLTRMRERSPFLCASFMCERSLFPYEGHHGRTSLWYLTFETLLHECVVLGIGIAAAALSCYCASLYGHRFAVIVVRRRVGVPFCGEAWRRALVPCSREARRYGRGVVVPCCGKARRHAPDHQRGCNDKCRTHGFLLEFTPQDLRLFRNRAARRTVPMTNCRDDAYFVVFITVSLLLYYNIATPCEVESANACRRLAPADGS